MTIKVTKAGISTVITGAANVDKVWTRERNADTDTKFREAFTSADPRGPTLHGWEIHWLRRRTEQMGGGEEDDYDTFRIRGYYAWKDEGESDVDNSSDAWDVILEAVMIEFNGSQTLGGAVQHSEPVELLQNIYVEAYGTFCHFAELELETRTRRSGVSYS